MLTITIQVNAPSGQAIGIKEDIAAYLEKFGDASVVSIVEKLPEQLRMDGPARRWPRRAHPAGGLRNREQVGHRELRGHTWMNGR